MPAHEAAIAGSTIINKYIISEKIGITKICSKRLTACISANIAVKMKAYNIMLL